MSAHSNRDNKVWGVGYMLYSKPGSQINPDLLGRAKTLILAVRGLVGVEKCMAIFDGVGRLYWDLPQTWAAWDERSDFVERRAPEEIRTFFPNERDQVGPWLCVGIDRQRTVMFLVPLIGFIKPPVCHYQVPDLPGPGDPVMSSEELLKIIDGDSCSGNAATCDSGGSRADLLQCDEEQGISPK